MKLTTGLLAAITGCVAATQPSAEAYLVPARDAASPPAITPSLARLLLLQHVSPSGKGLSRNDIPNGVDTETAVSMITRFGKATAPLFSDGDASEPSQLVLMIENMEEKDMKQLRKALNVRAAFTVSDPPSEKAHEELVELDFIKAGVANGNKCTLQQIMSQDESCWGGRRSAVAKFSATKNPQIVKDLSKQLPQLHKLAKSGRLHATVLLLPSSESSSNWIDEQQELRRRQAEHVISSIDNAADDSEPTSSATTSVGFAPPQTPIPIHACFSSYDECVERTANCSSHGMCRDKFSKGNADKRAENSAPGKTCFTCSCMSTRSESGSITHWGGSYCQKQDVSIAFWLFVGFTLALVGIIWMSISMLFNVGEEKLPGVIGAGVSRSK